MKSETERRLFKKTEANYSLISAYDDEKYIKYREGEEM